jgi:Leucine-rich repeat (LRR) protein
MKNTANKNLIITVTLLFLIMATFLYALFSDYSYLPMNYLGSGNIGLNFDEVSIDDGVFNNPGDAYSAQLTVTNTGGCCFAYSFEFNLTVPKSYEGLEKAVMLFLDEKLYGSLYDAGYSGGSPTKVDTYSVTDGGTNWQYKFAIDQKDPLYMGESKSHNLKLEYHIGAGAYYNNKHFDLNINCIAKSLTEKNTRYIYVKNYQFNKIIDLYDYKDKTIKLLGNTTLLKNAVITNGVNIDLNGYSLNLNGKTLNYTFDDAGKYYIRDSQGTGSVNNGSIIVNTPNGIVINEGTVFGGVNFSVTNSAFVQIYRDEFIKNYSKIASSCEVTGFYAEYADIYDLAFLSDNTDVINFTGDVLDVTTPEENTSVNVRLSFLEGTQFFDIGVTVLGSDESIINKIETENNITFTAGVYNNRYSFRRDLFLPVKDRYYGAAIEWITSDSDILTSNGKLTLPYFDTPIELAAVFSFNGKNILKTYYLTAQGKTNQEKIDEVCNIFGSLTFVDPNITQALPLVEDERFAEMGFDSFDFDLLEGDAGTFEFIEEGGVKTQLKLKTDSEPFTTYIIVEGYIEGEYVYSSLDVNVNLVRMTSIFDAAHNYVNTFFSHIIDNTFISFPVPSYYNDKTTITYDIKNGANQIPSVAYKDIEEVTLFIPYENPSDANDYVWEENNVSPADSMIVINPEKVPAENTRIYVEVTVCYDNEVELEYDTRLISFNISGVLHYGGDIADKTLFHLLRRVCDRNGDWYITNDEAKTLTAIPANKVGTSTSVSFNNCNIYSVKGLEYFVNLTSVNLANNFISDLTPLSGLYNLTYLNLGYNSILDISPLRSLLNLTSLYLRYNQITDISAVENLSQLNTLYLNFNSALEDLQPIENLPKLRYLYVNDTLAILNPSAERMNLNYIISAYNNAKVYYSTLYYYTTSGSTAWTGPTAVDTAANNMLKSITPVYEFSDVLFLPSYVYYGSQSYQVSWTTNFSDIVTFSGGRAYITQPVSDVDVKIDASILYGGKQYYRSFKILSRENEDYHGELMVEHPANGIVEENEISDGFLDAYKIITDDTLRYNIFKFFDTNANHIIDINATRNEVQLKSLDMFDLSGLGIKSIEGLQYLTGLQAVNLQNNDFEDASPWSETKSLEPLSQLTSLKTLYLSKGTYNFSPLSSLHNLVKLCVYGCRDLNTDKVLSDLYTVFCNNPGIEINKDSYLYADRWNPYTQSIAKALTQIKNIYVLSYGQILPLDREFVLNMYDGSQITSQSIGVQVNYTIPANMSYVFDYTGGVTNIKMSVLPAYDKYETLNATISYNLASVTAKLTVIILAKTDITVEWYDSSYINLNEAVPNYTLREQILTLYNGSPITREQLGTITSANLYCINDDSGLKSLMVFKGLSTFTTLNIRYFSPRQTSGGLMDLTLLSSADYPGLINLYLYYSNVNIYDLVNIKSQLLKLYIDNCANVTMYGGSGGAFDGFSALTSLTIINSDVYDFQALTAETMNKITELRIYGNPASTKFATDDAVNIVYIHAGSPSTYTYYVISSSTKWYPQDTTYIANTITDLGVKINNGVNDTDANCGVQNPNYGIQNGYTIKLPVEIVRKTVSYPITWTTTASATIPLANPQDGYITCTVSAKKAKAYVVLSGTVLGKTIRYVFVVDDYAQGDGDDDIKLDLNTFMTEGEFEDPVFAYRAISALSNSTYDSNYDGVYVLTKVGANNTVEKLATLNLGNNNNSSDVYAISKIKGIRNFTGLTTLYLYNNSITDISEIYYLTKLTNLRLQANNINSLYVTTPGDPNIGKSVFAQMGNLNTLYIYGNYGIRDYRPITIRETTNPTPADALKNLRYLYMNNVDDDIIYDKDFYKNQVAQEWWAQRKNVTNQTSELRLFRGNSIIEDPANSVYNITTALDILSAFDSMPDTFDVNGLPKPLTDNITVNGNTYSLNWLTVGTASNILTLQGVTITAFTAESLKTNHKIPIRVYVNFTANGATHRIGKVVYLNLKILSSQQLYIELSQYEYETRDYDANDKYQNAGKYYVKAEAAIPDGMLMNSLFSYFNTGTVDNIIDLDERANTSISSLDVSSRGVLDITGIELFPTIAIINLSGNRINAIPDMPISLNSVLSGINISSNYYLSQLSGLTYLENNDAENYNKISDTLVDLNLASCYGINNAEIDRLKDINLTILNVSNLFFCDFSFLNDLKDTLVTFTNTGNNRVYTNDNPQLLREFYLQSGVVTSAPSGVTAVILNDYIKIDSDYQAEYGLTSTVLPDLITIYGQEYGLIWSAISTTDYTITNSDGIYSIAINPTAGESVIVNARAVFGSLPTYSEVITLRTYIAYEAQAQYVTEADLYEEGNSLANYVPDPVLRYFIISATDSDHNLIISQAEINAITSLTINVTSGYKHTVLDYRGIGIFAERLVTLNLYSSNVDDFSPLSELINLTSLTIRNNLLPISDFSFMLNLYKITTFTLRDTVYTNMSFVMDMMNMTRLSYINATNTQDTAMYVKNAWAYGRTVNSLEELATQMQGTLSDHTSTADEKSGALILNKIVMPETEGTKGFLYLTAGESYSLPSEIVYKGVTYHINEEGTADDDGNYLVWQSLSDILTLSGNTLSVVNNTYKKTGALVAIITFNNACYYRYFEVHVN